MNPLTSRRILSAALAALHLALAVGAGAHRGPHLDEVVAELPADLHHHAYGLVAGALGDSEALGPCVACHLSRSTPRLASAREPLALPPPMVSVAPGMTREWPRGALFDSGDPRAPPRA